MQELIDELGALKVKLAPTLAAIKPDVDRVKFLEAKIGEMAPAGEQVVNGQVYGASVSQNANERTITSMPRLFRTLGQREFLASCSFPLKHFDACVKSGLITETEKAVLLNEEHTGTRKVTTFLLPIKTNN